MPSVGLRLGDWHCPKHGSGSGTNGGLQDFGFPEKKNSETGQPSRDHFDASEATGRPPNTKSESDSRHSSASSQSALFLAFNFFCIPAESSGSGMLSRMRWR